MDDNVTQVVPDYGIKKENRFMKLLRNNCFVLLAFFCSSLIMLLVFYCYSMAPFGDVTILRMDLYHQYGPLFAELYERVKSGGSMLYSWNTGLGGSFLGNFFNYLSSPLAFVVFFFKHDVLPFSISLMVLLKAAFASATFCYYLKSSQGKHNHATAAFGVMYSFCGFFIAYYWNIMWLDAMALFPLVMLGLERIISDRKFGLYLAALTVTMISNYYMAAMVCIFCVIYFIYRYFCCYSIGASISEQKQNSFFKKIKDKRFVSSVFTFGVASALAAMLALFALLPTIFILRSCSATSGSFPSDVKFYFTIFDFLANHLAAVEPTIRSSGDDVLPNVFCGMLTLILVPLYLMTKSISVKEKSLTVFLLGIFYFSFNVNFANYVWHGLHFPNDLPYRFSYMYSFILLIIAFKAFTRIRELTGKTVFLSGVGVVFFIIFVQEIGSKNVDDATILTSLAFAVIYTLILVLFRNKKFQAASLSLLLLCCVISEEAIADTDHYVMNQNNSNFAGDYNDFNEIKTGLDAINAGNTHYRMEMTSLRALTDPAWYNYNGASTFSSMASESLSNLQNYLGLSGNFINSYTYHPQTPIYNAMMSIKYLVKKESSNDLFYCADGLYTDMLSNDTFTAFKNNYYLPIAFCVDSSVEDWTYDDSSPFKVQSDFFELSTGVDGVYNDISISDVDYDNIEEFYTGFDDGEFSYSKIDSNQSGSVTFVLTPDFTQNAYLYVKSRTVESISVSHGAYDRSQSINEAYILDLGVCEAGENIVVDVPVEDDSSSGSIDIFACGIDMDVFENGYNILKSGQMDVSEYEDTHIKGTVTAPSDCTLYTSIPYDEGWEIRIDGAVVPISEYIRIGDALLGINIAEGTHTVELNYMPKGLLLGIAVSGSTLVLLLIFVLIHRSNKKKKLQLAPALDAAVTDTLPDTEEVSDEILPESDTEIAPEDIPEDGFTIDAAGIIGEGTYESFMNEDTDEAAVTPAEAEIEAEAEAQDKPLKAIEPEENPIFPDDNISENGTN